jgi:hypothetical protein
LKGEEVLWQQCPLIEILEYPLVEHKIRRLFLERRLISTIHADRSRFLTAYNRLAIFLKPIAEAHLAVAGWGVSLEAGDVRSVFGLDSPDMLPAHAEGTFPFFPLA